MKNNASVFIITGLLLTLFTALSCQTSIEVPARDLNPPFDLSVQNSSDTFYLTFYNYNYEEYFDEYRIYAGSASSVASNDTLAYSITTGSPYYNSSPNTSITVPLTSIGGTAVASDSSYWFAVYSYGIDTYTETDKPVWSSKAGPVVGCGVIGDSATLNNQNTGKTNDGAQITSSGITLMDAPDSVTSAWGGDFYFELSQNSPHAPMISLPSNGSKIQDLGYYSSIREVTSAPQNGYLESGSVAAQAGHIYAIVTQSGLYAKLYVTDAENGTEAISPRTLTFEWVVQTNSAYPRVY